MLDSRDDKEWLNPIDAATGSPLARVYVTQHRGGCFRTVLLALLLTAVVGFLLYLRWHG